MIAMPWPRLEITKLLVHAVQFGEKLGDQAGRAAMIGEKVVADTVPARAPNHLVAINAEEIARWLYVGPVAQLESGVEVPVRAGLHQIDGVMVGAAAQEGEEVTQPVRFAKAENVAIEFGGLLDVGDMEGDVAELVRHDAIGLKLLVREGRALEYLDCRAFGVLERHQL